jgi:pSer/pThr/pTyr-binding forkhead associated (FHA) protein
MPMKTYLIGRSHKANIVIKDADRSVSGIHLELTVDTDGRFYIIDCKSTNGTYRKRGGRWIAIQQTYVSQDEQILLGKYLTTVRELLSMRFQKLSLQREPSENDTHIGVERDPETGEIIPRRSS